MAILKASDLHVTLTLTPVKLEDLTPYQRSCLDKFWERIRAGGKKNEAVNETGVLKAEKEEAQR